MQPCSLHELQENGRVLTTIEISFSKKQESHRLASIYYCIYITQLQKKFGKISQVSII